ncbi:ROK family transcriptional regulator [Micromonospora chokoriensis]|uniref:Sugar kinase of the NBD/HSP70 family, may contain an N-terminal HTH domain n=1 Tax=Micromonospora chokoriensis TaxID=356851 RepID=A0A1C4YK11_9ACTN|nr:ROK family protein [Micromonospora chokoriensis]SCF21044.1 Sugar kinase of the NBD/HSP70 family, may contain an N-terminal HTH domain [Micromonospora chokoriensis]
MTRITADVTFLRGYNQARVMALGRTGRTFERSTVVEATGLTPQAVSKVIARLTGDGLIRPAGVRRAGIGKPAVVYELVPDSRYAIGAHVARRTLRLVLVDLAGAVRHSAVSPLPGDFTPEQLLDALASGVGAMTTSGDVGGRLTGVGIGMIGPLDHANGLVRGAHGLRHWHDVPLRELAEKHLDLPVHLDKDVTAGITAEAWRHGATFGDAALIMIESGIGGGFWLGGTAHRGAHTNAGEFGHTVVDLDGPRCVCGRHGCLEIVHHHAADAGDIARAARVVAVGVVNLLQTLDLAHVVLAGADLLRHPQTYLTAVTEAVRADARRADWLTTTVTLSGLGADAIAAGAAMQVLDQHFGVPELAPI